MNEIMVDDKKIEDMIYEIRGKQVMLDSDLAKLYQCKNGTKTINQAVKRNINRFPNDFYFQLNKDDYLILKFHFETSKLNGYGGVRKKHIYLQNKEFTQEKNNICLRSQFVTLNKKDNSSGMHIKYLPYVLTEQGIMMLSGLLKSRIATEINVKIMRAFVEMRKYINSSLIEQKYINEMVLKDNKRIGLLEESFDKMKEKTKVSTIFYEYVKNSTKSFYRTWCCNNYNNMKKVTH